MSLIFGHQGIIFGQYDFTADSTAGAIGSIDLGVTIPDFSIISEFVIFAIIAPTSGGAATLSFDIVDNSVSPSVVTVGALRLAAVLGGFTKHTVVVGVDTSAPVAASYLSTPIVSAVNIGMSIAVAPLTAGNLLFYAVYRSFEFA